MIFFSIPLPFPAAPKGNVLQMSGKQHGRAPELRDGLKTQETGAVPGPVGKFGSRQSTQFQQGSAVNAIPDTTGLIVACLT